MIRYLFVLYLGLVSVLLVDPNPIYALPLLLVLAGFMFDVRWLGVAGILGFSIFTLGNLSMIDLTDIFSILVHFFLVMVPLILLLEIILSPGPYKLERVSLGPILISIAMVGGLFGVLFLISRIQRIGVYLNSDPILQVFILIALSILFYGPPLLSSSPANMPGESRNVQNTNNEPNE